MIAIFLFSYIVNIHDILYLEIVYIFLKINLIMDIGKIVSKLKKPLLVSALALNLLGGINAQDNLELKIGGGASFDFGLAFYSKKLEAYDGWQNNFPDSRGEMELDKTKSNFSAGVDLAIEPYVCFKGFGVGLVGGVSLDNIIYGKNRIFSKIDLKNWKYDYVRIQEFSGKQTTPLFAGFLLKIPIAENTSLRFKSTLEKWKFCEEYRRSKDLNKSGKLKCTSPQDETEEYTEVFKKILRRFPQNNNFVLEKKIFIISLSK